MHPLFLYLIWYKRCVAAFEAMHFSCVALAAHFFNLRGNKMDIKLELLRNHISDLVKNHIEDFEIDASKIADTTATRMLSEVQEVVQNCEYSDFDAMEKIVCIFEKYNMDFGSRHDF